MDKWIEVYFGADELDQSEALEHQAREHAEELVRKATIILDERDRELDELMRLVKERYSLSDEETEIVWEGFNKKQLKALCEIDKESGKIFLRLKIDTVKKLNKKGGIGKMTERMTMEKFGNLVKFCEQRNFLTPEEVKVMVMQFTEEQVKGLSNLSEKAREYLKERGIKPFDYIRFNEPGSGEQLNKAFEK